MKILALDQGWRCGFARGPAGEVPTSGTFITYDKKTETKDIGLANLGGFVDTIIRRNRPDLIIWEEPLSVVQWREMCRTRGFGTNPASVEDGYRFDGVLQFVCGSWEGLRFERVRRQTVLKFFTEKSKHGGRAEGKEAVMQQCRALDLVPASCKDDDRCDAVAMHVYASSYYARRALENFSLTG